MSRFPSGGRGIKYRLRDEAELETHWGFPNQSADSDFPERAFAAELHPYRKGAEKERMKVRGGAIGRKGWFNEEWPLYKAQADRVPGKPGEDY